MVTFPYNTTDFAFTLEKLFINFSTENNSYFTLEIVIKYYEFYSDVEKTKTLDYKIPVFNGEASEYFGDKIHRNLENLISDFVAGFQVKTCLVTFTAKEIDIADDTVVETITLTDVKFIPGKRPKKINNNIGLLHENSKYCRITPKGSFQINFLLSADDHVLKIYKNETEVSSTEITATTLNAIYAVRFSAETYNAKRGDVFKIEIDGTTIFKEIGVIPATTHSHNVNFTNFNKLISSLEFTGEYSFPDKYKQLSQNYKRNAVDVVEIIETTEENFIKIDTGWILKDQVVLINELLNSKKVEIKNLEGENFEAAPTTKKRTGFDSTKFLYSYQLEFRINKRSDA